MRKARLFKLLLALATVTCAMAASAYAQHPEGEADPYVVTVYNESNGLPTGEANTVIQTSDGYIWIGSYGGLIRYDGSTFRNYSLEGELPSSSVRALFEDSAGRLWIGTNDAGVFFMEDDVIHPVVNPTENSFLCIRDFAEGYSEMIYVASNSGMALIHSGELTPCYGEYIEGKTVYSVAVDSFGRVWGALNSGMCAVVRDNEVMQVFSSDAFFDGEEIYCTAADESGSIYLGSSGSALVRLSFPTESLKPSEMTVERFVTESVTTHNSICAASGGGIIVCGNLGACVLEPDGCQISFDESDQATSVNRATIDYEGNIWLASTSSGVIKYTTGYFYSPNEPAGLNSISLNAIVEQQGDYYVATDNGLMVFDSEWRPIENHPLAELYAQTRVRSLIADSSGGVWAAAYSYTDPVTRYDPAGGSLRTFTAEDGLVNTSARILLELSDGSIAVGTQEGLNIIRDGQIVRSLGVGDGLEVASVLCLLEAPDGRILIGSDGGGIYEVDGGNVTCHAFSEGLSEGAVLRMLADPDGGGYFVSAGSSLYYWDGAAFRKLSRIQKGAGSIFDLYLRDGMLWILQNNGILAFDREKLLAEEDVIPVEYSFSHGLSGSLNANTWNWMSEDGDLYISTRNGVSVFRFRGISNPLPKGIISSANVDGSLQANPRELRLSSGANRLTLDFAALSFTDTTHIGISYALEGFDERETVLIGRKNGSISYTNLPGGEYRFLLNIFDPNDPGTRASYELPITKDKKPQEHPLLLAGLALLVLVVFVGVISRILRVKIRGIQSRERDYHLIAGLSLKELARHIDEKAPGTSREAIAELFRKNGAQFNPQIIPDLLEDIRKEDSPAE